MNPAVVDGIVIGTMLAGASSALQGFTRPRGSARPPVLTETLRTLYVMNVEANETRSQIAATRAARRRHS